ncbi:unnamed protein product [marine sediment metagenome]|uniref:Uncharacterized protein n=1 Tax=marine sediment metagenome TaxID=412755 RepID=X0W2J8_9ZZZZ
MNLRLSGVELLANGVRDLHVTAALAALLAGALKRIRNDLLLLSAAQSIHPTGTNGYCLFSYRDTALDVTVCYQGRMGGLAAQGLAAGRNTREVGTARRAESSKVLEPQELGEDRNRTDCGWDMSEGQGGLEKVLGYAREGEEVGGKIRPPTAR